MKNLIRKISYGICIVLACVLLSCGDHETKGDYLQRTFLEETSKQQYYTGKFYDLAMKDYKAAELYADSASMAYYRSHKAYLEMKRNAR